MAHYRFSREHWRLLPSEAHRQAEDLPAQISSENSIAHLPAPSAGRSADAHGALVDLTGRGLRVSARFASTA